jgi:hypothetical protein
MAVARRHSHSNGNVHSEIPRGWEDRECVTCSRLNPGTRFIIIHEPHVWGITQAAHYTVEDQIALLSCAIPSFSPQNSPDGAIFRTIFATEL